MGFEGQPIPKRWKGLSLHGLVCHGLGKSFVWKGGLSHVDEPKGIG